jgi:hypothetical protein
MSLCIISFAWGRLFAIFGSRNVSAIEHFQQGGLTRYKAALKI